MAKIPMTILGESTLKAELDHLTSKERPRIVAEIAAALAQGDLRENAEFQYAKEEQGFIEGRISEIAAKLSNAQVIDITSIPPTGKVIFGVTVHLLKLDDDEKVIYKIVGDDESEIKENKISVYSPIARAMIGKSEGDVVVVNAPSGEIEYEIEEVLHV